MVIGRRVAVVGGGAAGLGAAARLLAHDCAVTLFEPAATVGGNCVGLVVRPAGAPPCAIDVGVSDFNAETFVRFAATLDALGVRHAPICQDAAFVGVDGDAALWTRDGRLCSTLGDDGLVAEIARFSRESVVAAVDPRLAACTLGEFCRAFGYAGDFLRHWLVPRARGCFAMPAGDPMAFPMRPLVAFWRAHGLVGRDRPPPRMAALGGMHRWCEAMSRHLASRGATIRCGTRVVALAPDRDVVSLTAIASDGTKVAARFDDVVIAVPPPEAQRLVRAAAPDLAALVAAVPSQRARVVVHTDATFMPRDRSRWGAYNYAVDAPAIGSTITFFPKRLRRLDADAPDVFVTLGPSRPIDPSHVLDVRTFDHPVASSEHRTVVARIDAVQGDRRLWWCGSHLAEPFLHEHAFAGGEAIADRLARAAPRRGPAVPRPRLGAGAPRGVHSP